MSNVVMLAVEVGFGLVLLYYGAEWLVRGGKAIALRAHVSPLVIGLTLVAFGTSAPELFVSVGAALSGLGDVCVGNAVGSNICNIALILGLAVYTLLGVVLAADREDSELPAMAPVLSVLAVVGGLVALVCGAQALLDGAVAIEEMMGVPDEVVALTVVAVGTSLPELATSVVAAREGEADIAIGNIVGSNIFNILGVLGASAMIRPVVIEGMDCVDFATMIGFSVMLWLLVRIRGRLGRPEGALLLLAYAAYVAWLFLV